MTPRPTPVTVIGLGPMGRALAGAFIAAGHPTTVWNRTASKADALLARGAVLAATTTDAVRASGLVIVCVIDDLAAAAVLEPVRDKLKGRTVVNLSSDTPARARARASWAAEHGIDYVDGSIMTPTPTIGQPSAVVLYSGPPDVYAAHEPALGALGGTAVYLGSDPGRAAAYDVALLDLFWTAMSGAVHALALARAEGITAAELLPFAVGIGDLLPPIMTDLADRADRRQHTADMSSIESAVAGMGHIVQAAAGRGLDATVMQAARSVAQRAIDAGHASDGFSRLVETVATDARPATVP